MKQQPKYQKFANEINCKCYIFCSELIFMFLLLPGFIQFENSFLCVELNSEFGCVKTSRHVSKVTLIFILQS